MQSIVPHLRCACRARSYRREAPFKKEARGPRLWLSEIYTPRLRCACRPRSYRREAPFKKRSRGPRLRFSAIPMPHLRWGAGARWAPPSAFSAAASVGASPQPAGETAAHAPIVAEAVPGSQLAARANTISNLLYHTCGGMTNTIFLFQPSPVSDEKIPAPPRCGERG